VATSRDLASNGLWVDSLERSLARRGKPRRASLELGMLTPPRDLSDPDNIADSVLYWRTRRAAANGSAIPAAGGATALALLAATTIPTLTGGRSDTAQHATRGAGRIGGMSATRAELVARVPHRKPFDASSISALATPAPAVTQTKAAVVYGTVASVQKMLGLTADGKLGPATAAAIRDFQARHGLTVNGTVDETTFNAMQAAYTPPAQPVAPTTSAPASSEAAGSVTAHAAMASATTVAATAPVVATSATPATTAGASAASDATGTDDAAASTPIAQTTTAATDGGASASTVATAAPSTDATTGTETAAPVTVSDATIGTQPAVAGGVSQLQAMLNVPVDGTFGSQTKAAVEAFQAAHGLPVDGVVGPATREALGLGAGPTLRDTQPPPPAPAPASDATGGDTPASGDGGTTTTADHATPSSSTTTTTGTSTTSDSSSSDSTSTSTADDGTPANIATAISEMVAAANQIATLPYIWGGGHGSWVSPGYDCSGSVSYVLHAAGLLSVPEDSSALMSYGAPGPGKYITIYTSPDHAWMTIDGRRFDTVALSEDGSRWADGGGEFAGFVERHPVGF
jgi:peptidoglycan hydrolase-like protein with peptidoglycan-binding domain